MPTPRRFRNYEKGQSSVQYTVLVAFVVLAVIGFAKGYHASLSGVIGTAVSRLAAAGAASHDQSYERASKTELPWEGAASGQGTSR